MEPTRQFTGEKYNLRWNSHKNSLVNYLGDHLSKEELVDVTLACEGRYIKAHKLILSACSTYFKELFQIHNVDNPLIILNNVKFEELKYVIDFVYNGEIRVLDSDLEGVLILGNNLKIKGLSNINEKKLEKKILENKGKPSETNSDQGDDIGNKTPSDDENKSVQRKTNRNVEGNRNVAEKTENLTKEELNAKTNLLDVQQESTSLPILPAIVPEVHCLKNPIKLENPPDIQNDPISLSSSPNTPDVQNKAPSTPPPQTIILKSNPSKSEPIIKEPIQESRIEPLKNLSPNSAEVSNIPVKPVSAFMIFANEWRKRLTVEHPNETNKQISLRLGNMWKSLSDETKDTFYEAASRQYDKMKSQSDSRWKT
ncbi:hypothetical protein HHI36_011156 [Cryptolaemus montrouzieri]|uniref:Uncharacterized protein n=1 Tax=Cryptolaemus montrouzieri TaxID=559131 RepID=A0ABD2MKW5_9CUCU